MNQTVSIVYSLSRNGLTKRNTALIWLTIQQLFAEGEVIIDFVSVNIHR